MARQDANLDHEAGAIPVDGIAVDAVIDVALRAADLVLSMRAAGLQDVRTKSSASDIVTEADVAAEALIREQLAALAPALGFWGEESNRRPQESAFWVVDPIDGTNNFAMGMPLFAVNIALQDGPRTVIGVTVALPDRRIYWAAAGEGVYLRRPDGVEHRLLVSSADDLADVFLTTGFPYHRAENADNNSAELAHLPPPRAGHPLSWRFGAWTWHSWPPAHWAATGKHLSSRGMQPRAH